MGYNYEYHRNTWPTGGFEKALGEKFEGVGSAWAAVKKLKSKEKPALKNDSASQTMPSEYEVMSSVIKELELALRGYDYSKRPDEVKRLSAMPLKSVPEVYAWRDAWIEEYRAASFA